MADGKISQRQVDLQEQREVKNKRNEHSNEEWEYWKQIGIFKMYIQNLGIR